MDINALQNGPISFAPNQSAQGREEDLRKAAEGFEEFFLRIMLKSARSTGVEDKLTGSSAVKSTQDLFDAEIARVSSGRTGFGIADAVVRQFSGHLTYKGMK
ncbi:rod-binding protein [Marivivens sp. LCG002]|uniref:rod-binding protein n=1 Tax=Marivivens sp. LCG002 TaxID=3051171 RepID=UPI002554A217|nr:rod-binding protein [Marivivens sp. LCG002]WIV51267.1 rod-binding protein [Marivivens sp. LCG002]